MTEIIRKAVVRDENLVFKSNDLIEAKYRLSVNEQRIVMSLISMIRKEDEDLFRYKFTFKQLLDLLNLKKGKSPEPRLWSIVETLHDRKFIMIDGSDNKMRVRWIEVPIINRREKIITFRIAPELKPYLIQLRGRFTAFSLDNIQFKREYSFRLYELLKQYERIKKRDIPIPLLKEMLLINAGEYKLYSALKRRIIIPAQDEINRQTDISFEFEEIKEGRKVSCLRFTIFNRDFKEVEDSLKSNPYNVALDALLEKGISEKQSARLSLKYAIKDAGYILANIEYAVRQTDTLDAENGLTKPYDETLQGYIIRAVENNYAMFGTPEQMTF
jgi:plasmid replication initiation protein